MSYWGKDCFRGGDEFRLCRDDLLICAEINHGIEKATIILEVFNIFKTRKLPGLLEAFPELSHISLRLSLQSAGSSGLSTKPSSLALIGI